MHSLNPSFISSTQPRTSLVSQLGHGSVRRRSPQPLVVSEPVLGACGAAPGLGRAQAGGRGRCAARGGGGAEPAACPASVRARAPPAPPPLPARALGRREAAGPALQSGLCGVRGRGEARAANGGHPAPRSRYRAEPSVPRAADEQAQASSTLLTLTCPQHPPALQGALVPETFSHFSLWVPDLRAELSECA
ncbi:hypothetical protein H8959_012941 [Pygathrix nigripes]